MPDTTTTPQPGLLVTTLPTLPTPPVPIVARQIAARVQRNATNLYAQMYQALTDDYNAVWTPTAQGLAADGKTLVTVTPQQIFDAMKDAAGKPAAAGIVTGHGMLAPVIEQVRQLYGDANAAPIPQAVPAAFALTLNADGTVTVAAAPPAISSATATASSSEPMATATPAA